MESKYKLVILNPYFGKLPDIFPYWLKTCGYNPTIDWIVFTDDERAFDGTYDNVRPNNVRMIRMKLSEVKEKVEKIVGFECPLYRPYKICDYRPAYGLIFDKYVKGYDFWGYSDLDVLFGNLRKFVTDELLEKYDRIYTNGYLSFYRNTDEVNNWFRTLNTKPGRLNWKEVFSTEQNWEFDEWAGHRGGAITHIIEDNNKPMYMVNDWANILPRNGQLSYRDHGVEVKNAFFSISSDGVFVFDRKTKEKIEEVSFIHMFRRPPVCLADELTEEYVYLPPNVLSASYKNNTINTWVYHFIHKFLPDIRIKCGAVKNRIIHGINK